MNTHIWLVKILAGLVSIFQASTLRDRYYTAQQRIEILETALDDIDRINTSQVNLNERSRLIAGICDRIKNS